MKRNRNKSPTLFEIKEAVRHTPAEHRPVLKRAIDELQVYRIEHEGECAHDKKNNKWDKTCFSCINDFASKSTKKRQELAKELKQVKEELQEARAKLNESKR